MDSTPDDSLKDDRYPFGTLSEDDNRGRILTIDSKYADLESISEPSFCNLS